MAGKPNEPTVIKRIERFSEELKEGKTDLGELIQGLRDEPEALQQAAYWVLNGYNPYQEGSDKLPSEVAKDTICCVAIAPNNKTVVAGGWKTVRLWVLKTGELLHTFEEHSSWVLCVAISPDGNTLASAVSVLLKAKLEEAFFYCLSRL